MNIFLDFEGCTDKKKSLLPPILAGLKIKGKFVQYILDPEFKILENKDKNLIFRNFESFLSEILRSSIEKK